MQVFLLYVLTILPVLLVVGLVIALVGGLIALGVRQSRRATPRPASPDRVRPPIQ